MEIKEFEARVTKKKIRMSGQNRMNKVFEEIGEVAEAFMQVKKDKRHFEEECGDVVYRITRLLESQGSSLDKAMKIANKKYGG